MAPPPVIIGLVEHFAREADAFRHNLNETEVRKPVGKFRFPHSVLGIALQVSRHAAFVA
jgi:hypothetical protein